MTDIQIVELLDELTPSYDDREGDWERVTAAAREKHHRIAVSPRLRLSILLAVIGAAAALLLAWPFGSEHGTVLERALAAVGDGPVLHVVLRGEWGGTLVDLDSANRRAVYGDTEVWYDTENGQAHSIARLGGVVQDEELGQPKKPAAQLAALGREYKQALETGTARITGEDTIEGERVVWVTIHSELLPDVADGKDHEWAQQVAVSKRTFSPVALRETRDGQPGLGTQQRVRKLELLARGEGDFTPSRPSRNGTAFKQSREPITLEQSRAVLGRTPFWLGRSHAGLPLTRIYRETTSVGHQQRVRVTGPAATGAIKCSEQHLGADCFRALGLTSAVEVRPDGVFTFEEPIRWSDEQSGVVFYYGTIGDDPTTSRTDSIPLFDKPYLAVTDTTHASPFRRGAGSYVPPHGSVFITAAGGIGYLQRDGIQITLDAGNEEAVLAAARALMRMPG